MTYYNTFFGTKESAPVLSKEEEKALISKAQKGNKTAENTLVKSIFPYIIAIANKFYAQTLDIDDLLIAGSMGLVTAIRKFNVKSNFRLITYARDWISKAIREEIYKYDSMITLPQNVIAEKKILNNYLDSLPETMSDSQKYEMAFMHSGLSDRRIENLRFAGICQDSIDIPVTKSDEKQTFADFYEDENILTPEKQLLKKETISAVNRFLDSLSPRDAGIIRARNGFGTEKPLSFSEIGAIYGISKSSAKDIDRKITLKAQTWEDGLLKDFFQDNYAA